MPRPYKRSKIARSFVDLQARDRDDQNSERSSSEEDIDGFLVEDELEGEENVERNLRVHTPLTAAESEHNQALACHFQERARWSERNGRHQDHKESALQTNEGRIHKRPFERNNTLDLDISGKNTKFFLLPTKVC